MAPICGLCQGEMTDLDFHLEGKCQNSITGVTEHPEIGGLCKILGPQGPVYGTETCDHRCHLPKDGNLQFGFEHPRHCCTCDGSRPIGPTMMCDRAGCVLGYNHAVPDEHRCVHGFVMGRSCAPTEISGWKENRCDCCASLFVGRPEERYLCWECGGAVDAGLEMKKQIDKAANALRWDIKNRHFSPTSPTLPQTKSCGCGCGMEISTLGTALTVHDYAHWIVRNFDVSCSAQYLGDSQKPQAYKVTYSPDAVVTFRDIPWNLADEAASPIKDINWSIDANFPPIKSWTCKRGHSFRAVQMDWTSTDADGKTAASGPICPLCVLDFMNREFPAFEVKNG